MHQFSILKKHLLHIIQFISIISCLLQLQTVKAQTGGFSVNSVYQFAVPVDSGQAYLWVPPGCKQVKGLILSFANLLERNWLEDDIIRKMAAKDDLAIVLIELNPKVLTPTLKPAERQAFLKMLKDLAVESGYAEIEQAPLIPIDHSVHGVFTWNLAAWMPERIIAIIPVKTFALPETPGFKNIPLCYITGETDEWPPSKDGRLWSRDFIWPVIKQSALALRTADRDNLISVITDAGGGHLDWSDRLSKFMALYIHKACAYRLPKKVPFNDFVKLNKIRPESGWLTDAGGLDPDHFKPAPYKKYKGDPKKAYWFFDKETALAAMTFAGDRAIRQKQMLTFEQHGTLLPISKQGFVTLQFLPENDGITFPVQGGFLPAIPQEFIGAGKPIGHADGAIQFRLITGPAIQTEPDQFRITFNRSAPGGDIWIQEEHPGDAFYEHAVQPGQIKLPAKLTTGTPQITTFPKIANQQARVQQIDLSATTNTGLPVGYYVVSGPAVVSGHVLKFTQIPAKSKYPVKVTLTAYQWGRMIEPLYQSAEPVTQSFFLYK